MDSFFRRATSVVEDNEGGQGDAAVVPGSEADTEGTPSESDGSTALHEIKRTALELNIMLDDLVQQNSSDDNEDGLADYENDYSDRSEEEGRQHRGEQRLRAELDAAVMPPWQKYLFQRRNSNSNSKNKNNQMRGSSVESGSLHSPARGGMSRQSSISSQEDDDDEEEDVEQATAQNFVEIVSLSSTTGEIKKVSGLVELVGEGCLGDSDMGSIKDVSQPVTKALSEAPTDSEDDHTVQQDVENDDKNALAPSMVKSKSNTKSNTNTRQLCLQLLCAVLSLLALAGVTALIFRMDDNGNANDSDENSSTSAVTVAERGSDFLSTIPTQAPTTSVEEYPKGAADGEMYNGAGGASGSGSGSEPPSPTSNPIVPSSTPLVPTMAPTHRSTPLASTASTSRPSSSSSGKKKGKGSAWVDEEDVQVEDEDAGQRASGRRYQRGRRRTTATGRTRH